MTQTIGFVGLGTMGAPMARNLLRKRFSVIAYDLSSAQVASLCDNGAQAGNSPKDVASRSSVIVTMLPSARAVHDVALGDDGLIQGCRAGAVYLDMSTTAPATSRALSSRFADVGVDMLDAPVSRGHEGAIAGTLSVMVGGELSAYRRVHGVLQAMATDIFYCGPSGMGALFKLVNNSIVATTACAISEALVMGVKAGAELDRLLPVLQASSANGFVLEQFFAHKALRGDFEPGGSIDIVAKDLELALAVASEGRVAMPLGAVSYHQYSMLRGQGAGNRDFTSVIALAEGAAGVQVRFSEPGDGQ